MRISVDFDETLTLPLIEKFCKLLIAAKVDLWVLTSRSEVECNNSDIHETCDRIGLDKKKIIYCSWNPKVSYVQKYEIDLHIDNCSIETTEINAYKPHSALLVSFELGNDLNQSHLLDFRKK